jgi:hypothetical protein
MHPSHAGRCGSLAESNLSVRVPAQEAFVLSADLDNVNKAAVRIYEDVLPAAAVHGVLSRSQAA